MQRSLVCGLLALVLLAEASAEPPTEGKLPEVDGQRWVDRIGKSVGRDNWAIERKGNEITVRRTTPVAMTRMYPNAAPNTKPVQDGERMIQFVLRFAPKMSSDEYDRLAAVNEASEKEYDRLHRAVGLPHKFDQFIASTPEEKKRVAEFRSAVAKLPRHTLPDLYTPDHSLYFLHPWDGWSSPEDEEVAAECGEVEDVLMRLFGMYSPAAAAHSRAVGQYLSEPRR